MLGRYNDVTTINDTELDYILLFGSNNRGLEREDLDVWKDDHFQEIYNEKLSEKTVKNIADRKKLSYPFYMVADAIGREYTKTGTSEIVIDYMSRAHLCDSVKESKHLAIDQDSGKKIMKLPKSLIQYEMINGLPVVPFVNQKNVFYAFTIGCVLFFDEENQIESVIFFDKYRYNYFEKH